VNRQPVAAHQNRSMRRAVAPLRSIRRCRLQFGHRSILSNPSGLTDLLPTAPALQGWNSRT
jgi:hypothetical protein